MSRVGKPENLERVSIRHAAPEDAEGIREVFYRTWLDTYPNEAHGVTTSDIEYRFKNTLTEEGIRKDREKIVHLSENQKILVATIDGKIVGVCHITEHPDQNELSALYVLPEYQKQGVGKLLWNEAQKFLNPAKETVLFVAAYNAKAIAFYQQLGFQDTGQRSLEEKFGMQDKPMMPVMKMRRPASASGAESGIDLA